MNFIEALAGQPKSRLLGLGFAAVVGLGLIDWLTGPEISFSIFYLLPIALVAWTTDRGAGVVISLTSAIAWFSADLLAGNTYSHPAIPLWNAAMRLGVFLTVTYMLSALRASRNKQTELMHFIVHDLRAPVANVKSGLLTLQEMMSDAASEVQQELVEISLSSCDRMLGLINILLDLARLESKQLPVDLSPVSVKELADSALEQVTFWAKRQPVTLRFQADTAVEFVQADQEVTTRILVNLLSNAIKFSPSESMVSLEVALHDAHTLAFSITNRGPGVPKEWLDKVFDKFAQVETRTAGGAGSGLGLAFCKLAVEVQGGRIWLESEPGKNTTVTFTLPVHRS